MEQGIQVKRDNGVLRLRFDRPSKKNSITELMYATLADELLSARSDASIKVVCFSGEGGMFTAGNDLHDFMQRPPSGGETSVARFLEQIREFEKPMVAAVEGLAVGIGVTMLLHCDLVYVEKDTRFDLPFVRLGLVPEAASTYWLPLIAGYQRAAELLLLGEPFGADTAYNAGFVTAVVPSDELSTRVEKAIERLVSLPLSSLISSKQLMKKNHLPTMRGQMQEEGALFQSLLHGPAAKEAFTAFFAKRKPNFAGM